MYHDITYIIAITAAEHKSDLELTKKTPQTSSSRTSYGVSIERILEKNGCVITAPHCIRVLRQWRESSSSLLSGQWAVPSHWYVAGIHWPLRHWNWSLEQAVSNNTRLYTSLLHIRSFSVSSYAPKGTVLNRLAFAIASIRLGVSLVCRYDNMSDVKGVEWTHFQIWVN